MNQAKMPTAKARPFPNMRARLSPACWMKPKILSEITGRTHGMRLRMKPPMKPKRRSFSRPVGDSAGAAIFAAVVAVTATTLFLPNEKA